MVGVLRRPWIGWFLLPAPLVPVLVGFVVGVLLVYKLHIEHLPGNLVLRQPAAFSEVPDKKAAELAARFRPWLKFDNGERWRPLNIARLFKERQVGRPAHQFCRPAPVKLRCDGIKDVQSFETLTDDRSSFGEKSFINLAGSRLKDYRGPRTCAVEAELDCGEGAGSAIYYHVIRSNDRYYIDYWWFFRFNHFYRHHAHLSCPIKAARGNVCDEHEGDWEGITVVTPPDADDRIDYVAYAAHKGTFRYTEKGFKHEHGATRPDVYVARGSHASYPAPCPRTERPREKCKQPSALAVQHLITLPESSYDGGRDWERNGRRCHVGAPDSCLLPLPRTDQESRGWTDWPGHWGAGCEQPCRGGGVPGVSPQSPGVQARYQFPWCSSLGSAFTCDGKALGCSDWLGPLVVAVACKPAVLAKDQTKSDEQDRGPLTLTVRGGRRTKETTPGVVQALGDPLRPTEKAIVTGSGRSADVLVRARVGQHLVEARFGNVDLTNGRKAIITVSAANGRPIVRLDGGGPVEERLIVLARP